MAKYKMELKPVKMLGLNNLPEDKKQMLNISLQFLQQMLNLHEHVNSAEIQADMSIVIDADDSISAEIEQLHQGAVLTKIE